MLVCLSWVVNSTFNIVVIKVDHLGFVIERKWEEFSYLGGNLNRKSLGLVRGIKHHGFDVSIRIIVLIQYSGFPFLDRVPHRPRCGSTELG